MRHAFCPETACGLPYLPCCAMIFLRTQSPCLPLFFCALTLRCRYFLRTYPAVRLFYFHLPCCALFFLALTLLRPYFIFTYPATRLFFFALTPGMPLFYFHLPCCVLIFFFFGLTLLCPYFSLRLVTLRHHYRCMWAAKVVYANFEGVSAGLRVDFEFCPFTPYRMPWSQMTSVLDLTKLAHSFVSLLHKVLGFSFMLLITANLISLSCLCKGGAISVVSYYISKLLELNTNIQHLILQNVSRDWELEAFLPADDPVGDGTKNKD